MKASVERLNFLEKGLRDSDRGAGGDEIIWIEAVLFFLPFISERLNSVLEDLARKFDINEEVADE